jgi:hypothetical protein
VVAHIDASNIRRIYSRPRQRDPAADPSKVSTRIALAQVAAASAGLARAGRVHVFNGNARRPGLVLDEGLQPAPRSAVQPGAHALAGLDPVADVRQILHRDLGDSSLNSGSNNGLARFVIDVPDTPHLLAGDLPELLFRTLAAVGLETAAQGKVSVALVDAVPTGDGIDDRRICSPKGALRAPAIPPTIEIAGLLAEAL